MNRNRATLRYLAWVDRHRRAILLGSVVLCLLSAASLVRISFDANPLNMLPAGTPTFARYRALLERFGGQSTLVALIEAEDEHTVVRFTEAYAARLALQPSIAAVRHRFDPLAFTRDVLSRHLPMYLTSEELREVRRRFRPGAISERVHGLRAALTLPASAGIQPFVQQDPLGLFTIPLERLTPEAVKPGMGTHGGFLLSNDRRAALVLAQPRQEAFAVDFARQLLEECRAAAAEIVRQRPEWRSVRVRYTGGHAHVLDDASHISRDLLVYTTAAPLAIVGAFHLAYRNWAILPFVSYPLVCGLLLTFALSQLVFTRLDLISLAFSAIFYGLAIDAGIHFYTRLLQESRTGSPLEALERTLARLGPSHVVASLTTAAAFLLLALSHIRGVGQLGVLTAMAMVVNAAVMFLVFPATILAVASRMPRLVRPAATLDTPRLGALTRWAGARRGGLAIVLILTALATAIASQGFRLDTDFTRMRPPHSEPTRTADEITARFGIAEVEGAVVTEADDVQGALEKAAAVARPLARWQRSGRLSTVDSPVTLVPPLDLQARRWQRWRALPREQAAASLRAALTTAGFRPEAFVDAFRLLENDRPHFVEPQPDRGVLPPPLAAVVELQIHRGAGRISSATFVGAHGNLAAVAPAITAALAEGGAPGWLGGRALMEAELGQILGIEFWLFTSLGVLVNVLIVWISVRSVRTTLAVMLPPAATLALFLAGLHLADTALTPISVVVLPLLLGISVDDCIYLAERYRAGASLADVGRLGGRAVVMSSVTTMVGFGFLAFSRFPGLAALGRLTALAIALALVVALTTLPICLRSICGPPAPPAGHALD
jgi:hypothetical protein